LRACLPALNYALIAPSLTNLPSVSILFSVAHVEAISGRIVASAKAYMNALNRLLSAKKA